jgi:hypothetical protein
MTENINTYSFDFEKEVRRFRRALGDRADIIAPRPRQPTAPPLP